MPAGPHSRAPPHRRKAWSLAFSRPAPQLPSPVPTSGTRTSYYPNVQPSFSALPFFFFVVGRCRGCPDGRRQSLCLRLFAVYSMVILPVSEVPHKGPRNIDRSVLD